MWWAAPKFRSRWRAMGSSRSSSGRQRVRKQALQLALSALNPSQLNVPAEVWKALAPLENRDSDPERFASSAGYLFSPQDGARAVSEIVVGGLLDPRRMQRLAVISRQEAQAPSPGSVVSALVTAAFSDTAKTPAERDLAGVVQTEVAERLMVLAANSEATPEVRAAALAGVREVQSCGEEECGARAGAGTDRSRDHAVPAESGAEYAEAEIVRCARRAPV